MADIPTTSHLEHNLQDFIKTPVAFLLKHHTPEQLSGIFDEHGWNMMHWAVATGDLAKIKEFLYFELDFHKSSTQNNIPLSIYSFIEKKKPEIKFPAKRIAFCSSGFTPCHLAVFLFDYYSKISQEFFYKNIAQTYQDIIRFLLDNKTGFLHVGDTSFNTVFDYAFLLENTGLIKLFTQYDRAFSGLNNVNLHIAHKIVEVISIKTGQAQDGFVCDSLKTCLQFDEFEKKIDRKAGSPKHLQKL